MHTANAPGDMKLYTIAEAAELLRISRTSCYRLVYSGELAVHRVGGSLRISHDDLIAYLEFVRVATQKRSRKRTPPRPKLRHLRLP
jgi:excisionase family DNA binding protein